MKGILCSILRTSLGDCTANGLSSSFNDLVTVLLVGEGIHEQFEVKDNEPHFKLTTWDNGYGNITHRITPMNYNGSNDIPYERFKHGGNYLQINPNHLEYCNVEGLVGIMPIFDRLENN